MNQPAFNTHRPTQIEAEHKALLENPNIESMMTPDQVCTLTGISRDSLSYYLREGQFPPPDLVMGGGPRQVRRWFAATVFDFLKNGMPKKEKSA